MLGNFGFQELLLIFVIALVIFGPSKLPELGKGLGRGIREFKKATQSIQEEVTEVVKDLDKPPEPRNSSGLKEAPAAPPVSPIAGSQPAAESQKSQPAALSDGENKSQS